MQLMYHVGVTILVITFFFVNMLLKTVIVLFYNLVVPFITTTGVNLESRLFFKRATSWRPRMSRDLLISVASEMSGHHGHSGGVPELPVQVILTFIFLYCHVSFFFQSEMFACVCVV